MFALFLGCSSPVVLEASDRRDTLVVALQTDLGSLLPPVSTTATDARVYENLLLSLLEPTFDCRLGFEPLLAKSYSWSEDGLTLTFEMHDDRLWSDGTPVTAADVAFTYELVKDPLVASPRLDWVERMAPDTPTVIDDYTLSFTFTQIYARNTMLAHAGTLRIAQAASVMDADRATLRGHPANRDPVVNGPWRIGVWEPNQRITLVPNENYVGEDRPKLNRIVLKTLPEYATRLLELESGNADMVLSIQVEDAERLRAEHPEIRIVRRGWRSTDFLAYNRFDAVDYAERREAAGAEGEVDWNAVKPHPALGDKDVRRALSLAIDVDKLIRDLLTDSTGVSYGKRAMTVLSPAFCDYELGIAPMAHDTSAAGELLAQRGWVDTDGDGIRDKNGEPLSLRLLTNSGNPRRAAASVAIQAMLADVGVKIEIDKLEANTFFSRLRKKDFEIALSGWSVALFPDPTGLWHSGERYVYNYTSYSNPEVDALLEQFTSEPDAARGAELLGEIGRRIYEDQPYTFLYWRDELNAVHTRFRDAEVGFLSPWGHLSRWWVAEDEVKYAL